MAEGTAVVVVVVVEVSTIDFKPENLSSNTADS